MNRNRRLILTIAMCGVFAALSVALAYLAKGIFSTGPLRVTFENLPVFVISFAYGPLWGVLCAVTADLLSCLMAGMTPLWLVTVGSALVAFTSGVIYRYLTLKLKSVVRFGIPVFAGHAVGSMLVKSIALSRWYGDIVFWRIPIYLLIAAAETFLVCIIFSRKQTAGLIRSAGGSTGPKEEDGRDDEH